MKWRLKDVVGDFIISIIVLGAVVRVVLLKR